MNKTDIKEIQEETIKKIRMICKSPLIKDAEKSTEVEKVLEEYKDTFLSQLPKEEINQWISVEERLPDGFIQEVICVVKNTKKELNYSVPLTWRNRKFMFFLTDYIDRTENVTHWMPLPKAPVYYSKEGGKNELQD